MPSHIICISGPEGVGKDTLMKRVIEQFPQLAIGKKATTREPRPDDYDESGRSKYEYLTIEQFMAERASGRIAEHSQNATGGLYGSFVEIGAPGIEIRELDVNGALQLCAKSMLIPQFPAVTLIGIVPPFSSDISMSRVQNAQRLASTEDGKGRYWFAIAGSALVVGDMLTNLQMRLVERGDSDDKIAQKLARAQWEIPEILGTWPNDNIIVNDVLDEAVEKLVELVTRVIHTHALKVHGMKTD